MQPPSSSNSNSQIFRDLDAGFIGFSSSDAAYVWSTVDMVVQWSWELTVPVPIPGCELKYEFQTENYDISFGIAFTPEDSSPAITLQPVERATSHLEPAVGSCKFPSKGTARLMWDNSYSWFTPKKLSYSITMTLPEHRVAEAARTSRAQLALAATKEDITRASMRLQRTHQTVAQLHQEIPVLKQQLAALQQELGMKEKSLTTATQEAFQLETRIQEDKARIGGLCIRYLGATSLKNVFEYSEKATVAQVCKYWKALAIGADNKINNNNNNESKPIASKTNGTAINN